MQGIDQVLSRIQTIENRFSPGTVTPQQNFATVLAKATGPGAVSSQADSTISALVENTAKQYGVDPRLALAVAKTESGLDPTEVSPAGAVGVMQLMPSTARALGVNPQDPEENIDGGVRYLQQMINAFGGDTVKALAAYNAGPDAVRRFNGVPPYGETQSYVAKVLDLYNRG